MFEHVHKKAKAITVTATFINLVPDFGKWEEMCMKVMNGITAEHKEVEGQLRGNLKILIQGLYGWRADLRYQAKFELNYEEWAILRL